MSEKKYTLKGLYDTLNTSPKCLEGFEVRSLSCPVCGCENVHILKPVHKKEEYKSWNGRGDAVEVHFYCESGCHQWIIGFGFHKGYTGIFCEITNSKELDGEELNTFLNSMLP